LNREPEVQTDFIPYLEIKISPQHSCSGISVGKMHSTHIYLQVYN
jgi:hypothetical protein